MLALTIPWGELPTYNTVMSVAAGAGLLLIVMLGRDLYRAPEEVSTTGYSLASGVLGVILFATGLHMTLTWPLAPAFPYDNVIFGEPALAFGTMLLALAVFAWKRGEAVVHEPDPLGRIAAIARPMSIFVVGIGLSAIAIAAAGMRWQLFVAPEVEPVSGWYFHDYPWVEATFISGIYALVGVGAVLFPFVLRKRGTWAVATGVCWTLAGLAFLVFGAFNFFSHIGLIVETMPQE